MIWIIPPPKASILWVKWSQNFSAWHLRQFHVLYDIYQFRQYTNVILVFFFYFFTLTLHLLAFYIIELKIHLNYRIIYYMCRWIWNFSLLVFIIVWVPGPIYQEINLTLLIKILSYKIIVTVILVHHIWIH